MLNRRQWLLASTSALALGLHGARAQQSSTASAATTATNDAAPGDFTFANVIERAAQTAAEPFVDPNNTIPKAWRDLSYDQFRQIGFDHDHALWRDERLFQLQFFHPGFFYTYPVGIHIVDNGRSTPFPFDPTRFQYGTLDVSQLGSEGLGYAGLRVHYPLNRATLPNEFAVFLGASYFRLIGRDQIYGISARGLAVDTALPHGEEFPLFREFWIEQPAPDDTSLTMYALLDSAGIAGAYQFILRPRTTTQADVKAVLFPRRDIDKVGIAPLTSMFLYDEQEGRRRFDDFRPEVHDSDGMMLHAGSGEWLWRPLVNRKKLQVSSFVTENPRGFGLVQRDRDYNNYQDLESQYHRRPSLWVQPLEDWGRGRVELVEIPSPDETNDNIVCYWVSDEPVRAGQRLEYRYLLNAYLQEHGQPPGGYAEATRIGSATRPGAKSAKPESARLIVVDFNGGDLPALVADQPVTAVVSTSSGQLGAPVTQKNQATGGWRVFFDFFPEENRPADMRCYLKLHNFVLTETWNYLWTP